MSTRTFLVVLQTLITLVYDDVSQGYAVDFLRHLQRLLEHNPGQGSMAHMASEAIRLFPRLMEHKATFAGSPGDHAGNRRKQDELRYLLESSC